MGLSLHFIRLSFNTLVTFACALKCHLGKKTH